MARSILKWLGIVVLGLVVVVLIAGVAVFIVSNQRANQVYAFDTTELVIPTDAESIAEGERLVAIRACADCHGADLSGGAFIDDPALGTIYAANITPSADSAVAGFTAVDWDRAIRHGVNPQGKPLAVMPSTDYAQVSDEDIAMMIAYLQSVPAVSASWPGPALGPLGHVLVATNQIQYAAALIDHSVAPPSSVVAEVSAEYGGYLAQTCTGCHRPDFSGGPLPGAGPDDIPAANLTPSGHLGSWTQEQFINTLRTGVTPEGKTLDPAVMPWPIAERMSDDELSAIWLYLSSLPAVDPAN